MLRTIFCAVPALSRVDPAMNSGPTGSSIARLARVLRGDPRLHATPTVNAPTDLAQSIPLTLAATVGTLLFGHVEFARGTADVLRWKIAL